MLMEELFRRGIMKMGPSRHDPTKIVGVFDPAFAANLPAVRKSGMDTLRWMEGEWDSMNSVPATGENPAYVDTGTGRFTFCEQEMWICRGPAERRMRHITFDPFSKQYMYVLLEGAYGVLRSPGWQENRLVFTGHISMIGVDCEWRLRMTKLSGDEFHLLNEEQIGGQWVYIDEWRFSRKK